jgi:predicted dehydrogenase
MKVERDQLAGGPLRVAIIGAGDIATAQHLPAITGAGDEVVVIADPVLERAEEAAARFGIPRAVVHAEDAFEVGADAAVIATPPSVAPALILQALDAGLDVLSEKPMAVSVEAAHAVRRASELSDRVVQVGYKNRFHPLMRRLQGLVRDGAFGTPLLIRMSVFDELWQPRDDLHTSRIRGFLDAGPAFVHNGVHLTDFMSWTLGSPTWVVGAGHRIREEARTGSYHAAIYRFPDGSIGRLEVGWWYPEVFESELQVYGPLGVADLSRLRGRLTLALGTGTAEIVEEREDWQTVCFRGQWASFRAAVLERRPAEPSVVDACEALGLALAVAASDERGQPIVRPPDGWGAPWGPA